MGREVVVLGRLVELERVLSFFHTSVISGSGISAPLVMPILNSLLIDEPPEHCFSLSSFTLFYSSSFPFLFAYSSGVTGLGMILFILIVIMLVFVVGYVVVLLIRFGAIIQVLMHSPYSTIIHRTPLVNSPQTLHIMKLNILLFQIFD